MWICSKCAEKIKTKDPIAGRWKAGTCSICNKPSYVANKKDFGIDSEPKGDITTETLRNMFGMN